MKKIYSAILVFGLPGVANAQSAIDAMRFSQQDLKGTARFMAMGGAFGALGADFTSLSQNPGGIGVYRKQEIGFTLDLDSQRATASADGSNTLTKQTKFYLNNIGGVASINLENPIFRNFNIGFTYNRAATFNNHYRGTIPRLYNSMSNYFAGVANSNSVTDSELSDNFPYDSQLPWSSILAYDSYLIYPTGDGEIPEWIGQWNERTSGSGLFDVEEKGAVNEYNVALGGNIADVVYWGMDFGITDLSYSITSSWAENLSNAYIDEHFNDPSVSSDANLVYGNSRWALGNRYHVSGTGFNYKLGVILKPIQELRIGVAFHTPTWYSLKEDFGASVTSLYGKETQPTTDYTNDNMKGFNEYNFRGPWHFVASAAGVIGGSFIISADYEITTRENMKFSDYSSGTGGYYDDYDDWGWGWDSSSTRSGGYVSVPVADPYYYANKDIKQYYRTSSMIRVGAEYRIIPQFSVRAGFAYEDSPVKQSTRDNKEIIYTSGTMPDYTFDNNTTYISCGVGYRYKKFYADLAYQYKVRNSEYHAYTPDPSNSVFPSPQAKLKQEYNNIVLSMGFRF